MHPLSRLLVLVSLAILVAAGPVLAQTPRDDTARIEFFEKKVRPVLANNCYTCHSADTNSHGGLRLDDRNGILSGGKRGPAIVVGASGEEPADSGGPPHARQAQDAAGEAPVRERHRRAWRSGSRKVRRGPAPNCPRRSASISRSTPSSSRSTGRGNRCATPSRRRCAMPPGRAAISTGSCSPRWRRSRYDRCAMPIA